MGQSHSHHTDHQMLSFVDVRPYLLIERGLMNSVFREILLQYGWRVVVRVCMNPS